MSVDETSAAKEETGPPDRLVGVRMPYDELPASVEDWVQETLGSPIVEALPRTGGMSPAVAATVVGADGRRLFVKAVGSSVHPETPDHFRHEIAVLRALSALDPVSYRAGLLSAYDDGDWVAIALEDVDGRHPDLSSAGGRAAVLDAVLTQIAELTPPPAGVPPQSTRDVLTKNVERLHRADPAELAGLPPWAAADLTRLRDLTELCLEHQRDETFCHWDIRYDNILVRPDGKPVLLDWGMSRLGPRWSDLMAFGIEWVGSSSFDDVVSAGGLTAVEQRDVTGFLAGVGCYGLMMATHPAHPSLPNLPAFRRRLGTACLQGVRRRLADPDLHP